GTPLCPPTPWACRITSIASGKSGTSISNSGKTPITVCMIEDYNREDVLDDIPLLHALAPTIDLPAALFRGRYLKAVPEIELRGLPIDVDFLSELVANWQELRMHYIRRNDALGLYDDEGSFRENRFEALIEARGWVWTRTASGRPELRSR